MSSETSQSQSSTFTVNKRTVRIVVAVAILSGILVGLWFLGSYFEREGNANYNRGDFLEAADYYSRAMWLHPGDATLYGRRGLCLLEMGEFQLAVNDFNQSIQLDPTLVLTYSLRGDAYFKLGNYDAAWEDYNHIIIELDPSYALAYFGRANMYEKKGDIKSAIEDYNKFLDLYPDEGNLKDYAREHLQALDGGAP